MPYKYDDCPKANRTTIQKKKCPSKFYLYVFFCTIFNKCIHLVLVCCTNIEI